MADTIDSGESAIDTEVDQDSLNEEILKVARERFRLAEEAENEMRRHALDDLEFLAGKQWHAEIEQERNRDGRPCLVINRLPQLIAQVTNDQRQNRPGIKVYPVDDLGDEDTAEVIQGLIRHIEYNSNAEIAYDTAFESAGECGFGYFRIITDFVDPDSFDQEIYIKQIRNPFSVFFDPYSQEADGSDANWAFIIDEVSPDEYRSKYSESKLAAPGEWDSVGNQAPGWVKSDSVRVAEYLYREEKDETIHLLSTGETVRDADLQTRLAQAFQAGIHAEVVRSRQTRIPVIKWCKTNGAEILDQTEWPGSYIPVVPVYGKMRYINGKRILESIFRHAKDPQRMFNYWKSAETEAIALAPRAPFIIAEGQLEGYEQQWSTANRKNHAYLPYKPTSSGGQAVPPPQRQVFEPAVQAITQASMFASEDIKATTGIYDAGVGAQGNEVSGKAIQKRNTQVQTANFHFVDNLSRALKHAGRILVDLIPKIYDTERAARIIGEDGTQKVVKVNQSASQEVGENGKPLLYRLDIGRYDVTVDTGPSFATRRQEAAESMMDFSRAAPQVIQFCSDLIAKNMDWPGAQEISERLRKALPPQLQDDDKNKQIPPQLQAILAQQGQLIDSMKKELDECTKVIETKKLELEHKERIELIRIQSDAEIQMAKLGSQESITLLKEEMAAIKHRLEFLRMDQPIDAPNNFDPQNADGGNYQGIGHIGGTENITGDESPGSPMEGN